MENLSISHFRSLLKVNTEELKNMCKKWSVICFDDIPDEVEEEIRSTIGLTNLLLNQKLKQFDGLIDDSELKKGEKEITSLDLQGFWDMVYFEVEKIQKRFQKLEACQKNNWTFNQESAKIPDPQKKTAKAVKPNSANSKSHSVAARQRLAEVKLKMKALHAQQVKVVVHNTDPITEPTKPVEKLALKNIENLQTQEKQEAPKKKPVARSKRKGGDQNAVSSTQNENALNSQGSSAKNKKSPAKKSKIPLKDFIPLQCITRSAARKAMQNK